MGSYDVKFVCLPPVLLSNCEKHVKMRFLRISFFFVFELHQPKTAGSSYIFIYNFLAYLTRKTHFWQIFDIVFIFGPSGRSQKTSKTPKIRGLVNLFFFAEISAREKNIIFFIFFIVFVLSCGVVKGIILSSRGGIRFLFP